MSDYTDRTIQKLEEYGAALKCAVREAVVAVRGSQEFHDAVEALLEDTPYKKPLGQDHEGLYGRVRSAIRSHNVTQQKTVTDLVPGQAPTPVYGEVPRMSDAKLLEAADGLPPGTYTKAPAHIREELDELRAWRINVTDNLRREGGCAYADVPEHVRELRRRLDRATMLCQAVRVVLEGFDKGIFVRDVTGDTDTWWAVRALATMKELVEI